MVYLSVIPAPRNFLTPFGVLEEVINLSDTRPENEKWIKLVTDAFGRQAPAKQFQFELDVSGYQPQDLNVKVTEGHVHVEGKREVKHSDEHSEDYLLRQFKRKIALPENIIEEGLQCKLTADGKKLLVTAPLKIETPPEQKARIIPIQFESAAPKMAQENDGNGSEAPAATAAPATENVPANENGVTDVNN